MGFLLACVCGGCGGCGFFKFLVLGLACRFLLW